MARRIKLRVLEDLALSPRTVATMREQLGGRLEGLSDPLVGELLHVAGRETEPAVAVFADAEHVHLWVGKGVIRRVARGDITKVSEASASSESTEVMASVRAFASLIEGERVAFSSKAGAVERGTLVEKCRYGGLVLRADGVAVAVGFRRLWRVPSPAN